VNGLVIGRWAYATDTGPDTDGGARRQQRQQQQQQHPFTVRIGMSFQWFRLEMRAGGAQSCTDAYVFYVRDRDRACGVLERLSSALQAAVTVESLDSRCAELVSARLGLASEGGCGVLVLWDFFFLNVYSMFFLMAPSLIFHVRLSLTTMPNLDITRFFSCNPIGIHNYYIEKKLKSTSKLNLMVVDDDDDDGGGGTGGAPADGADAAASIQMYAMLLVSSSSLDAAHRKQPEHISPSRDTTGYDSSRTDQGDLRLNRLPLRRVKTAGRVAAMTLVVSRSTLYLLEENYAGWPLDNSTCGSYVLCLFFCFLLETNLYHKTAFFTPPPSPAPGAVGSHLALPLTQLLSVTLAVGQSTRFRLHFEGGAVWDAVAGSAGAERTTVIAGIARAWEAVFQVPLTVEEGVLGDDTGHDAAAGSDSAQGSSPDAASAAGRHAGRGFGALLFFFFVFFVFFVFFCAQY
jgi:hypothetical protein